MLNGSQNKGKTYGSWRVLLATADTSGNFICFSKQNEYLDTPKWQILSVHTSFLTRMPIYMLPNKHCYKSYVSHMVELRGFDRTWHLNPLMNDHFSDEQMAISWGGLSDTPKNSYAWLVHPNWIPLDHIWLVVYLPSEKCWSSSVGMMTFPTEWKVIKFMFQTTNQIISQCIS